MKEEQVEENIEKYLNEYLIQCEKCHHCNTVCPVVDTRVTQGPFGINRSIYYSLKWNEFSADLRDLIYSCTTCVKRCQDLCPLLKLLKKLGNCF